MFVIINPQTFIPAGFGQIINHARLSDRRLSLNQHRIITHGRDPRHVLQIPPHRIRQYISLIHDRTILPDLNPIPLDLYKRFIIILDRLDNLLL